MHAKPDGAFTGEISGAMLVDAGCTHVILGHSERRHGQGETDDAVNGKLHAALAAQLIPIVCIGETRLERESDLTEDVVGPPARALAGRPHPRADGGRRPGLRAGLGDRDRPDRHAPPGPGGPRLHPPPARRSKFGEATAARVVVQYGGSVKPDNAAELLACPDIDGALVGGASLKAADFLGIIQAGAERRRPRARG